jgi:hypothetical protein
VKVVRVWRVLEVRDYDVAGVGFKELDQPGSTGREREELEEGGGKQGGIKSRSFLKWSCLVSPFVM